jgi:Tfp pilus assembly protein PilO
MTRFIMPIILIAIAGALFFAFTDPLYNKLAAVRTQMASYNEALDNSKALENERDKLTAKYNSINPDDLMRLEKLLPENVDNIRLILEIEEIAAPYGMVLKDIKYNTTEKDLPAAGIGNAAEVGSIRQAAPKDYGIFDLEFSTSGTYNNFINFTKDLESNLRIVDISALSFSSSDAAVSGGAKSASSEIYKYNFKIKTYWLKN